MAHNCNSHRHECLLKYLGELRHQMSHARWECKTSFIIETQYSYIMISNKVESFATWMAESFTLRRLGRLCLCAHAGNHSLSHSQARRWRMRNPTAQKVGTSQEVSRGRSWCNPSPNSPQSPTRVEQPSLPQQMAHKCNSHRHECLHIHKSALCYHLILFDPTVLLARGIDWCPGRFGGCSIPLIRLTS